MELQYTKEEASRVITRGATGALYKLKELLFPETEMLPGPAQNNKFQQHGCGISHNRDSLPAYDCGILKS